jgi:hypothetical protein
MVAHGWEPYFSPLGVIDNRITFPAYAMGYSMIDAMYQGMKYLAWVNVVVGDPLTAIAWGKQELADDITWEGTNLVTGEITLPLDYTITLGDNAVVNFKHNGFIIGDGFVLTETRDFTLNINDWEKSLFRSAEDNHPKLIWGEYPYAPQLVDAYNIYRKWESTGFEIIDQVDASTFEYIDEDVEIYVPTGETPKEAEYFITAILQEDPNPIESIHSNTIDYWVNKAGKISIANNETEMEYSLAQNYPNPFNPSTTIKYGLKEDGLVSLKVYNILGSEIVELVNEQKAAGKYSTSLDLSNLASGTYFYVLRVNDFVSVKKMVLLK